jgi:hypothetical protein
MKAWLALSKSPLRSTAMASSYWRFSSGSTGTRGHRHDTFCGSSLAQPLVHRLADVALLALQFGHVACQLLVAAAQPGHSPRMASSWLFSSSRLRRSAVQLLVICCSALARLGRPGLRLAGVALPRHAGRDGLARIVVGEIAAAVRPAAGMAAAAQRGPHVSSFDQHRPAAEPAIARPPTGCARPTGRRRAEGATGGPLICPSARHGGSWPRRPRRCPFGRALLAEAHRFELASCTPSSTIERRTASARFWPSARLYSRPPRSSVWPSSIMRLLRLAAEHLGMGFEHGPVLVLDHEAVEIEVHDALRRQALAAARRPAWTGRPWPRWTAPAAPPCRRRHPVAGWCRRPARGAAFHGARRPAWSSDVCSRPPGAQGRPGPGFMAVLVT